MIFRATFKAAHPRYARMAARLRELALSKYGCLEFTSVTEGAKEIAISYWESTEQIQAWKEDAEHLVARELGKSIWYACYSVRVAMILRQYSYESDQFRLKPAAET